MAQPVPGCFSSRYGHRLLDGNVRKLPQQALQTYAEAIVEVDGH